MEQRTRVPVGPQVYCLTTPSSGKDRRKTRAHPELEGSEVGLPQVPLPEPAGRLRGVARREPASRLR